jgi:hypothetical protein
MGIFAVLCDNGLEQASAALLMWIEATTKIEAAG